MKKLDISSISDSSQMPVKKGTLQFLQDAYTEAIAELVKSLVGTSYSNSVVYILTGVVNSGTLPSYSISSGSVFYNGEVFLVDNSAFTATGTNVGIFSIVQTQYTTDADPVTFTDSAIRNIHNIRKIQVIQGASGSDIADYSQAFRLNFTIPAQLNLAAIISGIYSDNVLQVIGAYPNLNLYVPAPPTSANQILKAGSYNIGDVPGSSTSFAVSFGSTLSTASYYVVGTIISNGTPSNDTSVVWTIRNRLTTGFTLECREFTSGIQNIAFEYIIFAK